MSEPFDAPAIDDDAPPSAPLDPMDVPRRVWEDLTTHLVPYVLASLGYSALMLVVVAIIALPIALALAPGIVMEEELWIVAGGIFSFFWYLVTLLGLAFVFVPLLNASLIRAVDAQLSGGPPIGFGTVLSTWRQDAFRVILFYLLGQALVLIGMMFFYLPGILAAMLVAFVTPLVVLEPRVELGEALKRGVDHMMQEPAWHVIVWLLMIVAVFALEITLVGLLFLIPVITAWQVVAYRMTLDERAA